jgi:hypothetical protein
MRIDPVRDAVQRWAVSLVFRWQEWRLLLQRIAPEEPGLVKPVDPNDESLKHYPAALEDEKKTPVRSDQFKDPFLKTLGQIQGVLRDRCQGALLHHSEQLRQAVEGELGGTAAVQRIRTALAGEANGAADVLRQSLDPVGSLNSTAWLDKSLKPLDNADQEQRLVDRYFPLQKGGPNPPLHYAWHKPLLCERPNQFDPRHRHLMYVVKLRQVLIDAVLTWLGDVFHSLQRDLEWTLNDHVKRLAGALRTEAEKLPPEEQPGGPAD